jgi:hypothetical protein
MYGELGDRCIPSTLLIKSVFGEEEIERTFVLLLARIVVTSNHILKGRR